MLGIKLIHVSKMGPCMGDYDISDDALVTSIYQVPSTLDLVITVPADVLAAKLSASTVMITKLRMFSIRHLWLSVISNNS